MRTVPMMLAAGIIAVTPVPSTAHSWYPHSCCHGRDCGPAKVVEWREDGSRVVQRISDGKTVVVPKGYLIQISRDGALHVCINEYTDELMCIFDGAGV